jgi:ABC-type sugar transport system ATPase subunit
MPEIEIKKLCVAYGKKKERVPVLKDLSAVFPTGKISLVLGPSGSGKTTLLKALAGLLPVEGQILFDGVDVSALPTQERDLAYVAQDFWLYPRLTVFDNIAYPLKIAGGKREEVTRRVKEVAKELDLTSFWIGNLRSCLWASNSGRLWQRPWRVTHRCSCSMNLFRASTLRPVRAAVPLSKRSCPVMASPPFM